MKRVLNLWGCLCLMVVVSMLLPSCKKKDTPNQTDKKKTVIQQDPKVEEVLSKILKAWEKNTSFTVMLETEIDSAAGGLGHTSGLGEYKFDNNGDTTRIHFVIANVMTRKMKEDPSKTAGITEKLEFISDGHTMYFVKHQYRNKEVIKSKYNPADVLQLGGKDLIQDIKSNNRLQFLSETSINGKTAILIEAIPHEGDWKTHYYFEKDTGLLLKTIERDLGGKETFMQQIIKFDPTTTFTDDEFQYTVPEGYTLIDHTKD